MGKWISAVAVLLAVTFAGAAFWVTRINDYRTEGRLELPVLSAPVTVTRDTRGVAHIAAENRRDMLRAQGFITAQDRIFQMEFFKLLAQGRLAELLGEAGVASDIQMRVLGLVHHARRMAAQFSPEVKQFFGDYLDGLNAYIATQQDEFPLELSLLGHTPEPWTLEDSALILQYVSLQHSVNMKAEAVALALVDAVGMTKASSLMPINVNPDRVPEALPARVPEQLASEMIRDGPEPGVKPVAQVAPPALYEELAPLHLGSNNWVVGPQRSVSGAATVVNDPHLDARLLPGVWYPVGLSTAEFHAAGVALPALPGILVGRTDRVAFGVTNAYGDVQDLFIERVDPASADHYLEGDARVPFEFREEMIRIRDDEAEDGFREKTITVRSTHRGPVVSDHGIVDLGDRVLSLKWNAATEYGPEIGYNKLFFARSAAEVDAAVQLIDINMFNVVFADVDGNFGRRATGRIPVRRTGEGLLPVTVTDSGPYWVSWIPKDEMPGEFNPRRGWTGTANHDTRPTGYPYTYSTYFSPSYRYRRLVELLDGNDAVSADDHWAYMHDVKNLQAARLAPQLVPLLRSAGFGELADSLAGWSHEDEADDRAPLVYQTLYQELARATFRDELGDALAAELLGSWYFWQERFDEMVSSTDSSWFDNVETHDRVETLPDVVVSAAKAASLRLADRASTATWGDEHRLRFVSPMRRTGFGSAWVGGGDYPMSGSGETLRRARYPFSEPFETAFFASFNLVSDMAEDEEVMTALPGGVAARVLHKHYASQIADWHAEKATPTPLTRAAAQAAAVSTLVLAPSEKH
ncbi:MAG: penicillin acylase family protein [Pseudomonadota bacterium]